MRPDTRLSYTRRAPTFVLMTLGLLALHGCKDEPSLNADRVSVKTMPGFDNGVSLEFAGANKFAPDAPLVLGFDSEADLFDASGALLFRRVQPYYAADQGYSRAGSLLVQNRGDVWHGPLFRLPAMEPGRAFSISTRIKLVNSAQSTLVNLVIIRVANGEPIKFTIAGVNLNPGGWTKLEGEFVTAKEASDDVIAAYVEVESIAAMYLLDDFTITYAEFKEGVELVAREVETAASSFIVNGSAEEGLEPWSHQGGLISRSTVRAHTGTHSILITERSRDWHAATMRVHGLEDYVSYQFSIFVFTEQGQSPADMKLTLKSETDGQTTYTTLAEKQGVTSGAWVEVSGVFTSSSVSKAQWLTVYLESANPSLRYYVDTLTVKPAH